jgi:hypothetical protein
MRLGDWFRRHRNVFSFSTREVDAATGDEDMLREEYGEQAVEVRRSSGSLTQTGFGGLGVRSAPPLLDLSADGILEVGDEDEGEKPPRHPTRRPLLR